MDTKTGDSGRVAPASANAAYSMELRAKLGIYSEQELADALGVQLATVQTWRREGTGPDYVRINSKTIYYRAEDVKNWVDRAVRSQFGVPEEDVARRTRDATSLPVL